MVDKDTRTIQSMFATIAPRYDLTNRILSARLDILWRRHVARHLLDHPALVLDIAAGTGDLALELTRIGHHRVIAADFTYEMLLAGLPKLGERSGVRPLGADALRLPFRAGVFGAATVAFGVRNFVDPEAGLTELRRVLVRGGVLGVLEFSRPRGMVGAVYDRYARNLLPAIGGAVTGSRHSYEYLTRSVEEFPEGEAFLAQMAEAGFTMLSAQRLTAGIVTFYRGVNP